MSQLKQQNENAAAYAGLISQIGCTTGLASIIVIGIAFGIGTFLDNTFGTRGIFTILFLVGSFPVTLYVIVRLAMSTAARANRLLERNQEETSSEQEVNPLDD